MLGEVNTELSESRKLRWVSATELDMLPNAPVHVKNLAKYVIESHSKRQQSKSLLKIKFLI